MASSEQQVKREAYAEQTLRPLLDPLVMDCLTDMPDDPRQYLLQRLEQMRVAQGATDPKPAASTKGKAKGPSKGEPPLPVAGKGPGPPAPAAKGKGPPSAESGKGPDVASATKGTGPAKGKGPAGVEKGKGKGKPSAAGGFAPNVKKATKPEIFGLMGKVTNQREDGRFDNHEMGQAILQLYQTSYLGGPGIQDPGIDFAAKLDELGPAAATALFISAMEQWVGNFQNMEHTSVTVQTVGTGRGDAERVEYSSERKPMTKDETRKMISEMGVRFSSQPGLVDGENKPLIHGDQWYDRAEAFVAQHASGELPQNAKALLDTWFQTKMFEKKGTKAVSEEERRKKEEEQRKRDEERRAAEEAVAQHWRSLQSRPVDVVPWNTVRRGRWCSGGCGGATLFQIGDAEAVVLKEMALNAVPEVAAAELSKCLNAGVADCRVLHAMHDEWKPMLRGVTDAPFDGEPSRLATTGKWALEQDKACSMGIRFLMVLEFIPGAVLQGLDGNRILQSEVADSILLQVGRLIAFDCLLNNVDRVPAIWLNDGNFSNIMITKSNEVRGIDQQVNAIGDPSGRERYLKAVQDFVRDTSRQDLTVPSIKRVRTGVLENTGVELTDEQCRRLCEGATAMFRHIVQNSASLRQAVTGLPERMCSVFDNTTIDVGLKDVDKLVSFLADVITAIEQSSQ